MLPVAVGTRSQHGFDILCLLCQRHISHPSITNEEEFTLVIVMDCHLMCGSLHRDNGSVSQKSFKELYDF